MNPNVSRSRLSWPVLGVIVVVAALAPLYTTDFFLNVILTKALWLGVAAASLIFLAAYGGMVSLAQVGLYGVAGMTYANLVLADGGSGVAWNPWLAVIGALVVATLVGLGFGWIAARSEGIYFLMITLAFSVLVFYFFSQVTQLSGFGGVNNVDLPGILGNPESDPAPRYFVTLAVAVVVFIWLRALATRTAFGLGLQGVRDEPARMRALGFDVTLHRLLAFGLAAFVAAHRRRAVGLVQPPHHAGVDQPRADDQPPDHRGDRRPLPTRRCVGRRARVRADRQLLARVGPRGRERPRARALQHDHRARVPDHRPAVSRRPRRDLGGRPRSPARAKTGRWHSDHDHDRGA